MTTGARGAVAALAMAACAIAALAACGHGAPSSAAVLDEGGALRPEGPARVAAHPTGRLVFAVAADAVVTYAVDPATGTHEVRSAVLVHGVRVIEVDPEGRFVWGLDPDSPAPTVWTAAVDPDTGALRTVEREPAGWRPVDLQRAGRYLYVANADGGDVWGYAMEPATGALRAIGRVAQVARPRALAADRDGRRVHVVGDTTMAFRREEDGRLSPLGRVDTGLLARLRLGRDVW